MKLGFVLKNLACITDNVLNYVVLAMVLCLLQLRLFLKKNLLDGLLWLNRNTPMIILSVPFNQIIRGFKGYERTSTHRYSKMVIFYQS